MKRVSTLFLKTVILLIAIFVLVSMLWFPQTEGRAADLDLISIYTDPFIMYMYIASIPFFVGLYQAFRLTHLIETKKAFSHSAVQTLKYIQIAAFSFIGFIALALVYIRFFVRGEDPAGPTMIGIVVTLVSAVIATTAGILQTLFQNAMEIKTGKVKKQSARP